MSRPTLPSVSLPVAALLVLATFGTAPASAQLRGPTPLSRTQYGIGYVANAPEAMVGAGAYVLSPRWGGIGIYADAKLDASNPSDELGYDASVTASEVAGMVGGKFIKTEGSWRSFNIAVMRPLTPSLIAYVGGGLAKVTEFDLYNVDPASPVGLSGVVWAKNPDTSATRANLMVGVLMRLTRHVSAHFGYETQPNGVTVGGSLRLPAW